VPSIFVRNGPGTPARRPFGRRNRPHGQSDRITLEWMIRYPDLRLRGTPGTRQPRIPQTRYTGPQDHESTRWEDHIYPQYPQVDLDNRARPGLREPPAVPDRRHRADRANICLNRRDALFKLSQREVIHRLLRCPAHTEGGVVAGPSFSAFTDLSTDNSTIVENLNGA